VFVVVLVAVGAFYSLNGAPDAQVNEMEDDMQVNIGSGYPGMVDMVSAVVDKNQSSLITTITVKEPFTAFGDLEFAQFDIIMILEKEEDVLQTYELIVDLNSTGTFGVVQDVQTETKQDVQLQIEGNKLTVTANLVELSDATYADWSISSVYEKRTIGDEIICSVIDFVPDEGLSTTYFSTD